jgi:predicted outer membrane protein
MYGIAGRLRDGIAPPCRTLIRMLTIAGLAALLGVASSGTAALAASSQDRSFLYTALQDDADFRTLSNLAMQKIKNSKVRAFAQTISRQTDSADDVLVRDAKRDDVKPPGTLSPRASDQYGRIQAQSGSNVVHEFLRDVAIDARISAYDYSSEAQGGSSPSLKRLASRRAADLDRVAKEADSLRSGSK